METKLYQICANLIHRGWQGWMEFDDNGNVVRVHNNTDDKRVSVQMLQAYLSENRQKVEAICKLEDLDGEMSREREDELTLLKELAEKNGRVFQLWGRTSEVYQERLKLRALIVGGGA